MCWRCQEIKNQRKSDLKRNKHSERKIVFAKNVIRNTISDEKIKIQSRASLLFNYDNTKVIIIRLMQLNCQLKKLYSLNISIKQDLLPLENSLGFVTTSNNVHQSQIKLFQLQKTKQWLINRILENASLDDPMVLNQKEDLLIIGGDKIYILEKQNDWNVVQIIRLENHMMIKDLSLYDDKHLICKTFSKIFILQKNQNRWALLQRIDFQFLRQIQVFFISDEIFVYYHSKTRKFDIYKLNETKKEFTNTQLVRVYGKYTSDIKFCFIHELNMLVAVNGKYINTFEIKENGHISLKKIFTWDRNYQSIVQVNKNFLVTKFLNKKMGILINKMKVFD